MRPRLLNPLRERPRDRSARRSHRRAERRHAAEPAPRQAERPSPAPALGGCDPDVERARRAGGPIDEAVYTCGCGYLFSAAVSTTVSCPHCGTDQAW